MDDRSSTSTTIERIRDGRVATVQDIVAVEEPMEVRIVSEGEAGQRTDRVAVTMRTPGHDFELAVGFLLSEGLIARHEDVVDVSYCPEPNDVQQYNVVQVTLAPSTSFDQSMLDRNFYATSSCGVCGKTTLDQLELVCPPVGPGPRVSASVLSELPGRLRSAQKVFDATGGLHAAGEFDAAGAPLAVREDVGRHNAVDKLVGRALLDARLPCEGSILMVSGRLSFEIVQKAAMAGFAVVCAVSAPSSLAVATAARLGQTLVGFLRDDRFVVYTGAERIEGAR